VQGRDPRSVNTPSSGARIPGETARASTGVTRPDARFSVPSRADVSDRRPPVDPRRGVDPRLSDPRHSANRAAYRGLPLPQRTGFGLPSIRRNVCPHFYVTGSRGAIPIQAPHLLKALIRQEQNVSRCQLRGGVHLEQSYVNDVCLTPRFNQCVFYEDELSRD
jgi:hypothetical protein